MTRSLKSLASLFVAAALLASPAAASEKVRITVRPVAEVRDAVVRLGDVAEVDGGSPELISVLQDMVIGPSPSLGRDRVLTSLAVTSRLRQKNIDVDNMEIEAPRYVRVYREAQEVSEQEIRALIESYLETHFPFNRGRIVLRSLSLRGNRTIPKGKVAYDLVPPRGLQLVGNPSFKVLVRVDGEEAARLWAALETELLAQAVRAARFLPRGHIIKSHELVVTEASVGKAPNATFFDIDDVVGKRLARSVNQGQLILRNHLESPKMVRRGTLVTLVVEQGALKVTARGVALEDGEMGKIIRVKNLASEKTVFARVMDASTVRVDL